MLNRIGFDFFIVDQRDDFLEADKALLLKIEFLFAKLFLECRINRLGFNLRDHFIDRAHHRIFKAQLYRGIKIQLDFFLCNYLLF